VAIRRVRLEYTVYPPHYNPDTQVCFEFRILKKAKNAAKTFGSGAEVWRSVQQTNKRGERPGNWWDIDLFLWTGQTFKKVPRIRWGKYKNVNS
jgi:hypothetical protein